MNEAKDEAEKKPPVDAAGGRAPEPPVERDRRGIPLPARQRVGGIITPQ